MAISGSAAQGPNETRTLAERARILAELCAATEDPNIAAAAELLLQAIHPDAVAEVPSLGELTDADEVRHQANLNAKSVRDADVALTLLARLDEMGAAPTRDDLRTTLGVLTGIPSRLGDTEALVKRLRAETGLHRGVEYSWANAKALAGDIDRAVGIIISLQQLQPDSGADPRTGDFLRRIARLSFPRALDAAERLRDAGVPIPQSLVEHWLSEAEKEAPTERRVFAERVVSLAPANAAPSPLALLKHESTREGIEQLLARIDADGGFTTVADIGMFLDRLRQLHGMLDIAESVLQRARRAHQVSARHYLTVLEMLARRGADQRVAALIEQMADDGLQPSADHYQLLATAHANAGRYDEAIALLTRLSQDARFLNSTTARQVFVNCALQAQQLELAETLLGDWFKDHAAGKVGSTPKSTLISHMLKSLADLDPQSAIEWLDRNPSIPLVGQHLSTLSVRFVRARDSRGLFSAFRQLAERVLPDPRSIRELLLLATDEQEHELVLETIAWANITCPNTLDAAGLLRGVQAASRSGEPTLAFDLAARVAEMTHTEGELRSLGPPLASLVEVDANGVATAVARIVAAAGHAPVALIETVLTAMAAAGVSEQSEVILKAAARNLSWRSVQLYLSAWPPGSTQGAALHLIDTVPKALRASPLDSLRSLVLLGRLQIGEVSTALKELDALRPGQTADWTTNTALDALLAGDHLEPLESRLRAQSSEGSTDAAWRSRLLALAQRRADLHDLPGLERCLMLLGRAARDPAGRTKLDERSSAALAAKWVPVELAGRHLAMITRANEITRAEEVWKGYSRHLERALRTAESRYKAAKAARQKQSIAQARSRIDAARSQLLKLTTSYAYALSRRGRRSSVERLLSYTRKHGIKPSPALHEAKLVAVPRSERLDLLEEVRQELHEAGSAPSAGVWTTFVAAALLPTKFAQGQVVQADDVRANVRAAVTRGEELLLKAVAELQKSERLLPAEDLAFSIREVRRLIASYPTAHAAFAQVDLAFDASLPAQATREDAFSSFLHVIASAHGRNAEPEAVERLLKLQALTGLGEPELLVAEHLKALVGAQRSASEIYAAMDKYEARGLLRQKQSLTAAAAALAAGDEAQSCTILAGMADRLQENATDLLGRFLNAVADRAWSHSSAELGRAAVHQLERRGLPVAPNVTRLHIGDAASQPAPSEAESDDLANDAEPADLTAAQLVAYDELLVHDLGTPNQNAQACAEVAASLVTDIDEIKAFLSEQNIATDALGDTVDSATWRAAELRNMSAAINEGLNRLVDMLRLAGRQASQSHSTSVVELAEEVAANARSKLTAAATHLEIIAREESSRWHVRSSRTLLAFALENLLSNAAKELLRLPSDANGQRPPIELSVTWTPAEQADIGRARYGWVVIGLRDHAGGLPAGLAEDIANWQLSGDPSKGLGLGLQSTERAIRMSGGALIVDDSPMAGTRFLIRLPAARSTQPLRFNVGPLDDAPGEAEIVVD